MAYVRVDLDRKWIAQEGMLTCPQIIQMVSADTPYVAMDFTRVLTDNSGISSVTVTEVTTSALTFADQSIAQDNRRISFKISGGPAAGTYVINVNVQLSGGTTNKMSKRGIIRVT